MGRDDSSRPRALVAASAALAAALACVFARRTFVGFCNDDADYVLGALSILQGRLVALNSPSGHAFGYHWPGLSLLLAPFASALAPHWQALKIVPMLLVAASAGLVLRRLRRRLGAPWAALAAAIFFLNPWTLQLASILLAEPLLLLLALLAFERLDAAPADRNLEAAILALMLGFAALARPEGVVLAAAAAAALALKRRPRSAAGAVLGPLVSLALWTWAKSFHPGGPSYWTDWHANLGALRPEALLLHALSVLTTLFAGVVFALPAPRAAWGLAAGAALSAAALGACAAGAADERRRGEGAASGTAAALFFAGVLLMHLLWPVVDGRFFWPLLPFALEALAACGRSLSERSSAARPAALALFSALIVWSAGRFVFAAARPVPIAARLPVATFRWARANIPADAAVLTNIPQAFFLYTSRRGALTDAAEASTADELRDRLEAQGFAFVCYRVWSADLGANLPGTERAVRSFADSLRVVESRPDEFPRVFYDADEGAAIYAVAPRPARRGGRRP